MYIFLGMRGLSLYTLDMSVLVFGSKKRYTVWKKFGNSEALLQIFATLQVDLHAIHKTVSSCLTCIKHFRRNLNA